ncbi:hypothetical protein XELAEV_18007258mg [Xenopus laevis]|uniref:Olfactory receptor n=1 Tax=Xenopus laevis TaxID=8355 RepID=A0A974E2N7_XENLA|nr:hypothetical protein XELAEV_18007258mg [Xenopus laevis]
MWLFLVIYILTVVSNTLIITMVWVDSRLHIPMYTVVPKTMHYLITQDKVICVAQLCFVHSVGPTEFFLLTVMAYDRYLAICHPLRYATMMSNQICLYLAIGSWMSGFFTGWTLTIPTAMLKFCGPNLINHFFCDYIPLVGKKAFSTCAAHLTIVLIFYGTVIFMYVRPRASYFSDKDKVISLFYSVITPLLNPLIYSLRNREFRQAMKKMQGKIYNSFSRFYIE